MTEKAQRRLAAIVAADIVGYSRLMHLDEDATMAAWWAYKQDIIAPTVADYGGRVVKWTGDGFLAEFSSATDSVTAAIAIQTEIASRTLDIPDEKQVLFRMGINLGDILWDDEDIYGDGVNIAARIEALANPGGILIAANIYDQIHNHLSASIEDLGTQHLKHIDTPQKVYRIDIGENTSGAISSPKRNLSPPDMPSVAVLPFENKSTDPEQSFFSDGLTENIIAGLTRFRGILVIGLKSISKVHEYADSPQEIGQALGVAHIVEGNIQKIGNHIRVTVKLIEAATGQSLWAENYDRDLDDIFKIQDEITNIIVTTLASQIEHFELHHDANAPCEDLNAYDCILKGRQCLNRYTREADLEARQHLDKALSFEPDCAAAYAALANSYLHEYGSNWTDNPEEALETAYELAKKAVTLDSADSLALYTLSCAFYYRGQHELAIAHIERALAQNPNDYHNVCTKGYILAFTDQLSESTSCSYEAIRLNPLAPANCLFSLGVSEYAAGRYEEALIAFGKANGWGVFQPAFIAASYAQLGRDDQAKLYANEVRNLIINDPCTPEKDDMERWRNYWSRMVKYTNPSIQEKYFEGIRKAGLPA